ncbi:saccharopine dehydrogenase NADP-binding domain-containing protein [Sphingomonas hankookensis]|uniref:saccharopine dehydrogenase NADP-binding domain-containing protein n=1 Tax=Sphingomonas hankookensis TaxID=563996 RepID=UPI001F5AB0B3|nr:saccharopine dehydrogenase NADP-binding domain-containing protein [Sphingomonas hankookensis]
MAVHRIGVFGANGHTGRFVAAELARRGVEARWIGRDGAALSRLQAGLRHGEARVTSVDDSTSMRHAFDGLNAVINCAGPFFDTCQPVIEAALMAGCHVLDVTAEQVTVLDTIATFDASAKAAGRVVMPAMAFFGGLADLLASSIVDDWPDVDAIEIAVALDSWHPTTGTRLTGERNTATRLVVRDGVLAPVPSPPPASLWPFPKPFGSQPVSCVALSEIVLLSRHLKAWAITSYMNGKPLADLADAATPLPQAQDALGRSDQMFAMSVRAERRGHRREATVTGRDIYFVTAPLVVEACLRLLADATPDWAGVRAPGELFDARDFLAALADVLVLQPSAFGDEPLDGAIANASTRSLA